MEIVLKQPFELGGKRASRIRMAEADDEIVEFAHESTKRDISAGTKRYFFEVIAAQRRLERAGAAVEMAKKVADAVSERGKAGKETPPQVARLNAVLDVAKMSELDAEMVLSAARRKLSMMWGEASPRFTTAECEFDVVEESLVPLDVLKERLLRNPELLRIESEIRLRRAEVSAEKAERVPDIDAAIGYQSFEEDGSDSYIFAIDVPLPLFNRNQGKISVAIAELAKTETGGLSRKSQLLADLETAFFGLSIAHKRVQLLSSKVIPVMQTARDAVLVGYREGKFELLEVIEAQRSLFEAEGELVNALLAYHIAATEIDRLTYMPEEND